MARWRRRSVHAVIGAVAALVLSVGGVMLVPGAARACTCGPSDPLYLVDHAEMVFMGSATDRRDPETGLRTLTFAVDTVVKGEPPPSFEIVAGGPRAAGPTTRKVARGTSSTSPAGRADSG